MDLSPPPPASQGLGAAPESGGTPCRHPGERRPCPRSAAAAAALCFSCGVPTLASLFSGVVLSWKSRVVSWSTGVIPRGVTCRPCSGGPPAAPRLCGRDAGAGRRVQVLRQGASALTAPVGPPCVSAAAPNRVLENGHTGETRLALRDPAREPAAPTPWLPVLSLTCSGQACRVSPSSQESEQSPGVQLRPPGTCLSARAERSGAQCRVVGTHCGSGQLGAGFQLPVHG